MPIHQSNEITRSTNHFQWLEKNFTNVISVEDNLSSVYDEFVKSKNNTSSSLTYSDEKKQLAFANTRSRLRMINLYFHATSNNYIVAGTGMLKILVWVSAQNTEMAVSIFHQLRIL